MTNKTTLQIRINRSLHKQLKYRSVEDGKTITRLASQMISHCLTNNIKFNDEIYTIEF